MKYRLNVLQKKKEKKNEKKEERNFNSFPRQSNTRCCSNVEHVRKMLLIRNPRGRKYWNATNSMSRHAAAKREFLRGNILSHLGICSP